jgi:SAM-dependent methyltransferase
MTVSFVDPNDRVSTLTRQGDALISPQGRTFPIREGIPDFTDVADAGQRQTSQSFGFKWTAHDWGFRPEQQDVIRTVWRDFFGWKDGYLEQLVADQVVLDAGCGSGASLNQFVDLPRSVAAVDISEAVYACRAHFRDRSNIVFARADLTRLPFRERLFDVVWSAGVLHHTPNSRQSLGSLVRHLKTGGRIVFYVYVKKAPIREFADDHVRAQIAPLPPEEAWRRMEALTALARNLSALKVDFVIDADVPELGFKKGRYDVQRFIYYNLFKCYWNEALSFEDNVHVNFDWYHPTYAHRHTPDEVAGWLDTLGLEREHFHVSNSGIAVVARRVTP